jgi:hypothetical protein
MTARGRRWATLPAVLAVVLSGVTLAPAASAKGATTSTTVAPVPKKWDPRLKPIADKVAELRKLKFEHPVAAEFLGDAAFEKKVAVDHSKLTKTDKEDIARSQGQLRALGLIGPDVDILGAVESLQQSGVLAYYEPKTQLITVKGTDLSNVSTRVTVAHELTHALQDQHFDLQKLSKNAAKAHGSTALQTLVEGDAVRTENAYKETLSNADQQAYTRQNAEVSKQAQSEITAKGVPDTLSVLFQAPYVLGRSMLMSVIAKDQEQGVDKLFEDPPVADASFVTPSTLLDHRTFQHVPTPALQKGEKRSGKADVFGSLALFQVLASRLDNATALSAADAWDGDAMATFTRKGQTCLRATFAGKGTDGIATLTDAWKQWAAQVPAGTAVVDGTADRVTVTACDPGAAATAIPNPPFGSLVYLDGRDSLFSGLLQSGAPTDVATCSADALVRDPVFAPIVTAAGTDPNAEPDPATITALQARVRDIVAGCRTT